jgi:3-oxoacyl-[acyl-carrier-protein] synthase-3
MNIQLNNIHIKGIAVAVPKQKLDMKDLEDKFSANDIKRIAMSTGIDSVRIATNEQKTSDFCFAATQHLLKRLFLQGTDIDGIIFVSQTPDHRMPSTSCILQHKLGLPTTAVAFDINYGCSGYIYGLYQASLLINSGSCQRVLVCVGDTISKHLNPDDQKARLVFGDGGAATIVEKGEGSFTFNIMTDGSGYESLIIPSKEGKEGYLEMDGSKIMEFALREVPPSIETVLNLLNWSKEDLDMLVFHQANKFMIDYLRKKMELPKEILPIAVKDYGNTGPTSIPLALCACQDEFKKREKVILSGFGVGLSWGSVGLNLSGTILTDVIEL